MNATTPAEAQNETEAPEERGTYTATVGITVYANSREEAEGILDDMSMHDDCRYFNVHDIEDDDEADDQ